MKHYILEHGGIQDNVISIGSPKHDKFFRFDTYDKGDSVLIVVSDLFHSNFEGMNTRTFQLFDEYIKQTYIAIKKITNKKIIVKLRPTQSSYNAQQIIKELDPHIPIYKTQDIFEVLNMCDTVISLNFSTVVLDSMILKKPTITILPENQGYEDDVIMKSGATIIVNKLDELESKLRDILTNENLRQRLIEDGQKIVNEYFVNQGSAADELAKFVNSSL